MMPSLVRWSKSSPSSPMLRRRPLAVAARGLALAPVAAGVLLVAGCSGTAKPKPAELPANVAVLGVREAWSLRLPKLDFPMTPQVSGDRVTVAGGDGTVVMLDATSGREVWRASVGAKLAAGVGSDGNVAAVVTTANDLVALQNGKVIWKQHLPAQAFTAPLVAGRRVFVQTADRTTSAWDGQSGRRLWSQTRTAENLVLRRPGVLIPFENTLVAGIGGRLAGLDPATGGARWEVPIAAPRGTNDVERLVDLTGSVSRVGESICARAYMAAIGCVDAGRGVLQWSKPATGATGVSGTEDMVYGTETDGVLAAWRRRDGEKAWSVDRYKWRDLTAPLAVGRSLIFGDGTGLLHFVSRTDGAPLNRVTPDGSGIEAAPVVSGNTVIVVTRNGGVFGYRPE